MQANLTHQVNAVIEVTAKMVRLTKHYSTLVYLRNVHEAFTDCTALCHVNSLIRDGTFLFQVKDKRRMDG